LLESFTGKEGKDWEGCRKGWTDSGDGKSKWTKRQWSCLRGCLKPSLPYSVLFCPHHVSSHYHTFILSSGF